MAHTTARALTSRACATSVASHGARSARDSLLSYNEITTHYRLSRLKYPPAHPSLTYTEERLWRLAQTESLPNRALLHHIHPSVYPSPFCPLCGDKATVQHHMWACPYDPLPQINSSELWEAALSCSDPERQKIIIARATKVAAQLRLPATSLA